MSGEEEEVKSFDIDVEKRVGEEERDDEEEDEKEELLERMKRLWRHRPPSNFVKKNLPDVELRTTKKEDIFLFGTRSIRVRKAPKNQIEVLSGKSWILFYDFIQKNEKTEAVRIRGVKSIPKNFKMEDVSSGGPPPGINMTPFE